MEMHLDVTLSLIFYYYKGGLSNMPTVTVASVNSVANMALNTELQTQACMPPPPKYR